MAITTETAIKPERNKTAKRSGKRTLLEKLVEKEDVKIGWR